MNITETTPRLYGDVVAINVDVQNDFCPGGSLAIDQGDAVVEPLNRINRWVRKAGGFVVATRDKHPAITPHFDKWPVHCVADTRGGEFHPQLELKQYDAIVSKGMGQDDGYSGFDAIFEPSESKLGSVVADKEQKEQTLGAALDVVYKVNKDLGHRTLILVGGLAGDYCVPATAEPILELPHEWVDVIWLEDAVRSVDATAGEQVKQALIDAGMYAMTVDEVMNGGIVIDRTRLER